MEIQLYKSEQGLSNIPNRDSEIAIALQSRMFNAIPDVEAYKIVKDSIIKCYISARYESPTSDELQIISDETMKIIKSRFGSLRENELQISFTRGIISEYGEFKGLSVITFIFFIKSYLKEDSRIKLTTPMQEIKKHTDYELYELSKQNAYVALNEFRKNNTVGRFGVVVYDFLSSLGILNLEQQEKNKFWAEAKNEYSNFLISEKIKSSGSDQRKRIDLDIKIFNEGGKKERLIVISKRLVVDNFYQGIVFDESDLLSIIDERKNNS